MTPQPVTIYGKPYLLENTGGGSMTYRVTDPRTGAIVAQQASRFMAVAVAARTLLGAPT